MKEVTRTLQLFVMQGHQMPQGGYAAAFEELAGIRRASRRAEVKDLLVAFPDIEKFGRGYVMQAIIADPDANPIVFDYDDGSVSAADLGANKAIGSITHLYVSPNQRRVAIEYVKRGPKHWMIAEAVQTILRRREGFKKFNFELVAAISENFAAEINSFTRIRQAFLTIKRPNIDWEDSENFVNQVLGDSNAGKGTIVASASRGEALRKRTGLVQVIKDAVGAEHPSVDDAGVTGQLIEGGPEKTVHSKKFVVKQPAKVQATDDGNVVSESIYGRLRQLLGAEN